MNIGFIILITFIAGAVGTGIGGLIGALIKKNSNKSISLLLSLAAGIMLAVVCFDLLVQAIQPYYLDNSKKEFIFIVLGFTVLGYLIVYLLNYIIDRKLSKEVPHTSKDHPQIHDELDEMIHSDHIKHHKNKGSNLFMAGLVTAIVIALHNIPEGMIIGASYAIDETGVTIGTGLIMAIVIGLHNIPEGMAVSVPLISGGMKKAKAVLATAASGLPTVIGAIVGYYIGNMSDLGLAISLSLASGAMLYVVFGELLPEAILKWKSKLPTVMLFIGLLLGFILILI